MAGEIATVGAGETATAADATGEGTEGETREETTPRVPEEESFTPHRIGVIARVREDIRAVRENDPAARNLFEILTSYPGLHALWLHRFAHLLWRRGLVTLPRFISHITRFLTGIEIHPGARLGRRVFIDHGMGVVIGETAVIGDDVLIYKGVVLGGTSIEKKVRHPWIGRRVVIGSNACILGAIVVGDGARIGSGSVVIRDVPEGATVVGIPGRVVEKKKRDEADRHLAHADLPDPVARAVRALTAEADRIEKRVAELEKVSHVKGGGGGEILPADIADVFKDFSGHEGGSGI